MPAPQIQGLNSQNRRFGPQKVFVYGTLKRGFGNHGPYLNDCKELGNATVEGIMFHLGGFPAINLAEKFTKIHGEVYETDWDRILEMDRLEGVGNNFYSRIEARVEPQGIVWMYIFPHHRAIKEDLVVPSGIWRGPETPSVKWKGFGKGVEIGSFATDGDHPETIKVGPGDGPWELCRSGLDASYKLINKDTGEILGSFQYLRDMIGKDGRTKPVLRLPAAIRGVDTGSSIAQATVKEILGTPPTENPVHQHPHHPILWTPQGYRAAPLEPEIVLEEKPPQAARLLGLKYGEA